MKLITDKAVSKKEKKVSNILNSLGTGCIEIKKLVYLMIIIKNYISDFS